MSRADVYHSHPGILGGTPVFTGTRVPVDSFVQHLREGRTLDEFLDDFPSVTREQAEGCLALMTPSGAQSFDQRFPNLSAWRDVGWIALG